MAGLFYEAVLDPAVLGRATEKRTEVVALDVFHHEVMGRTFVVDVIGADNVPRRKPDPGLLIPLLEKYGVEKTATVIIGDGVNHILLAKNTGTLSCALLNGLGN